VTVALLAAWIAWQPRAAFSQESRPRASDPARAVASLSELVASRRFADAWKSAAAVRAAVAAPGVPDDLRRRAHSLIVAAGLEVVGAAAGLKGTVAILERDLVEVAYDFSAPGTEDDFDLVALLPAIKEPERRGRTLVGTGALGHRAIWTESLRIELTGRPLAPNDFGPLFFDPDEEGTERFLTGFHNNAYFGVKYDDDRSVTPGHVLLLAGRGAVSRARVRPTQLLGRSAIPTIARGAEVKCALSIQAAHAEFRTGTSPTATALLTFDLAPATQTFRRMRAGVLVRNSEFEIATVLLRGRLDPAWSREETDRLRSLVAAQPKER
jgi:hypothetical protein